MDISFISLVHLENMTTFITYAIFIFLLFVFAPSISATNPVCSSYFGSPIYSVCEEVLYGRFSATGNDGTGISMIDRRSHLFAIPGISKPQIVTANQWSLRYASEDRLIENLPLLEGCNVALLSVDYINGGLSWDTSSFPSIANDAWRLALHCVKPGGGITSTGGYSLTGDHSQLVVVIFGLNSIFSTKLRAKIEAGDRIAASEVASSDDIFVVPPGVPSARPDSASTVPDTASSTIEKNRGLCGSMYCTSTSKCSIGGGCTCIADTWQAAGSRLYMGRCRVPYSTSDGRELTEVDLNAAASGNSTFSFQGASAGDLKNVACPCNCTYVSNACCNSPSGIVHEALSLRLGSLQPPSSTVTCNPTTGEFQ
ncbi:hypothetical protein MMC12_008175 [Toensbergia leucococca]|nr:hypothetical protein [Toensbergia leucococca]